MAVRGGKESGNGNTASAGGSALIQKRISPEVLEVDWTGSPMAATGSILTLDKDLWVDQLRTGAK